MARLSECPANATGETAPLRKALRIWEVGANLGDCSLAAASLLSLVPWGGLVAAAHGLRQPASAPALRLRAFEPMPQVAAAFRRSAAALMRRRNSHPHHSGQDRLQMQVEELALGETASATASKAIGVPIHSAAEATFNDCMKHYDHNGTGPGCSSAVVGTSSVDLQLLGAAAAAAERTHSHSPRMLLKAGRPYVRPPIIDLLKIHVQGDELRVLRGAKAALASGLLCAITLRTFSLASLEDDAVGGGRVLAAEVERLLRGYRMALVDRAGVAVPVGWTSNDTLLADVLEGAPEHRQGGWVPPDGLGRDSTQPFNRVLVAWRSDGRCRRSLGARAAAALYGNCGHSAGAGFCLPARGDVCRRV
eukprot:TRINITY_DN28642_c0_g1_i2.p1 TRINITY_DN28642_c0_g1~~TRINITY_DN28642_c0_g1_i2.p1  ORF type:complete len:425 (-),score=43.73 TRINITY_DN28642_c0_g1_i2:121-1209(-)